MGVANVHRQSAWKVILPNDVPAAIMTQLKIEGIQKHTRDTPGAPCAGDKGDFPWVIQAPITLGHLEGIADPSDT